MSEIGILEAIILGMIQGITEWLPISSSGHLSFVQLFLGLDVPVFYDMILHVGSLSGVFVIYRNDLYSIIISSLLPKKQISIGKNKGNEIEKNPTGRRMIWLIIAGTIPTAIIGLVFRSSFESSFYDPFAISAGFLITGLLLLATKFLKGGNKNITTFNAIIIGIGQGISIFSSISRSGATISAGLFRGIDKNELVRYSFLLSIPAILGAATFDIIFVQKQSLVSSTIPVEAYIAGLVVSAIVGYLSIKILISIVLKGSLYYFSAYCFAIGILSLIIL